MLPLWDSFMQKDASSGCVRESGYRSEQTCRRLWEANPQAYRTGHCSLGMRNELPLRLKWLDMAVHCSRVRLPRGEIERCESRSLRQSPAPAPRPPYSYCKEEAS